MPTAWALNMLATRTTTLSPSMALPHALDAFVGSALELVIHSVEALRDRLGSSVMRAASPLTDRER